MNNGEVLAEYILTDDSIFDSSIKDSSLTSNSNRDFKINTSDYMPESSATNSMSISNEFVTMRKKKTEIRKNRFDLKKETEEEERILINKIIAQLSSSIASDVDSNSSVLKNYEGEYSPNEASPPKQKRISMTFNRAKKNNECTKLEEKSTNRRRSFTLQVIKQHNHVSHLNNHVLKNNLKKSPNISEKNSNTKKSMQSLTKNKTPNKFDTSSLARENLSCMNKWLDETIISKSPNLVIGTHLHEKKSKLVKTPTFEKRPSPIFARMTKKSPVLTPTKARDRSPRNLNGCLTPISRIPRPKKYFTTPSHLRTVKRSLETPTKTVVPNKRKVNPPEKLSTAGKSSKINLNETYSKTEVQQNSADGDQLRNSNCEKESFRKIAMNLDNYKYDDDLDDERKTNVAKHNAVSKSNAECLSVFDKEFERWLPRSDYVSGIGMLESGMISRSDSNSKSRSPKGNSLQFDLQETETLTGPVETASEKESVREKIQEENEISQDFRQSADAYSSLLCTIGSDSSLSSDSYLSLSKNDDVAADNADNENVDLKAPLSPENNLTFEDSNCNTSPKLDSETYLSIEEEYKYEDSEEGINFLERRLCVTPSW